MSTQSQKNKKVHLTFAKKAGILTAVFAVGTFWYFEYRPLKQRKQRAQLQEFAKEYWSQEVNRKHLEVDSERSTNQN